MNKLLEELDTANEETVRYFINDLGRYYTGRPTPMLLDGVKVEYYGDWVDIERCATITVANANMLLVSPYERRLNKDIERAIHKANLGLNPQADSECVKVYLPKRTKEADLEIFKLIKDRAETARVAARHNRMVARNSLSKIKDSVTEDEYFKTEKQIQDVTDAIIKRIDSILENKRKEMRV